MPIYEYACRSCNHQQEAFQSIKDEPLTICEKCQQPTLTRLVSAAGFRLKGGGWYETDFKGGDKKKNLAGESPQTLSSSGGDSKASTSPAKENKESSSGSNSTSNSSSASE